MLLKKIDLLPCLYSLSDQPQEQSLRIGLVSETKATLSRLTSACRDNVAWQ